MKFEIVTSPQLKVLHDKVNERLASGFKLYGNPFAHNHEFCQGVTIGDYVRPNRVKAKEEKSKS